MISWLQYQRRVVCKKNGVRNYSFRTRLIISTPFTNLIYDSVGALDSGWLIDIDINLKMFLVVDIDKHTKQVLVLFLIMVLLRCEANLNAQQRTRFALMVYLDPRSFLSNKSWLNTLQISRKKRKLTDKLIPLLISMTRKCLKSSKM